MAAEKESLAKEAGRLEQVGCCSVSFCAASFVWGANRRVAAQSWLRTLSPYRTLGGLRAGRLSLSST